MVRLVDSKTFSLSKLVADRFSKPLITGLAITLSVVVAGCATTAPEQTATDTAPDTSSTVVESDTKDEPAPDVAADPDKAEPPVAQPNAPAVESDKDPDEAGMVTVSVYTIDDQCTGFVEESVQVPSDVAMDEAVGKAMNAIEYNAFKLNSYDVNIQGGTAIVNMQLDPGSERQFVSLSSCEQLALFGSVEETLLNNPEWQVESVQFTDGAQEIVL